MAKYRLVEGIDLTGYYIDIQCLIITHSNKMPGVPEWSSIYKTDNYEDGRAKWQILKSLKAHYRVHEELEL